MNQQFDVDGTLCGHFNMFYKHKDKLPANWIQIVKYALNNVLIKSNLFNWSSPQK